MDRRSSSRRYGVEIGAVKLTTQELDLIRSNANTILIEEQGGDTARAWTTAVLNMLVKKGLLDPKQNLKADESA